MNVIMCGNFPTVKLDQQLQPAKGPSDDPHCSYCLASTCQSLFPLLALASHFFHC